VALVLSVAYFFGMPDAGCPDHAAMASENDWTAQQVQQHPDRLFACCSVNPLLPGATAEVERCAATGSFVGLKLHLANSDVDLRDPGHLELVGDVFECANAAALPIVVHMRTRRPDYGAEDVRSFIDDAVGRAPDVATHIAHAAGWGGYDTANDDALSHFAHCLTTSPGVRDRLYFDLAVAPLALTARPPDEPEPRLVALVEHVRAIGIDRFLFGTDWPVVEPQLYLLDLIRRVPFDQGEIEHLAAAVAPWIRR
jgi:predicted TIM-barrel fold metal-dependent hydrolase